MSSDRHFLDFSLPFRWLPAEYRKYFLDNVGRQISERDRLRLRRFRETDLVELDEATIAKYESFLYSIERRHQQEHRAMHGGQLGFMYSASVLIPLVQLYNSAVEYETRLMELTGSGSPSKYFYLLWRRSGLLVNMIEAESRMEEALENHVVGRGATECRIFKTAQVLELILRFDSLPDRYAGLLITIGRERDRLFRLDQAEDDVAIEMFRRWQFSGEFDSTLTESLAAEARRKKKSKATKRSVIDERDELIYEEMKNRLIPEYLARYPGARRYKSKIFTEASDWYNKLEALEKPLKPKTLENSYNSYIVRTKRADLFR